MANQIPTQPASEPRPVFRCEHCGAKSYHPDDVVERYCGRCHHFCDQVAPYDWAQLDDVPLF